MWTMTKTAAAIGGLILAVSLTTAGAAAPERPECIAPAQPGGGFDLTCKLAQSGLQDGGHLEEPMRVTYMPGGIGAVAYNAIVAQRPDDGDAIVAFSGGSLLNLAIGKFGKYDVNDVRWLAGIATDYGMLAVREDSPYENLTQLMEALKEDPTQVVLGAGGTVGSQDWMKAALIARGAGVNYEDMRYVAFEGGGESLTALLGGHIQAYSGDAGETLPMLEAGKIKLLAVLADERLPGLLADVPTAKEQGYDITWPIIRGFYVGPDVPDEDFQWWVDAFDKMLGTPEFDELRTQRGLFPFNMTGDELDAFIKERVTFYADLAKEFGLIQ